VTVSVPVNPNTTTQEAPAVTEDSVPELRPRRTKLWVAVAVVATAGATYGLLVNAHLLRRGAATLPPAATTSAVVASASATATATHVKPSAPATTSHHAATPSAHPSVSSTTKKKH
jgi:hypothetical protein